jgi:predicted RNA-binding Zn-ribbon protein involved in translation (DUF1610 family)
VDDDTIAFPDARHRVKVGDLREWHYGKVICEDCRHMGILYPAMLLKRYDPETPISDLAAKFKCAECGKVGTRFWDAWRIKRNA